MKFVYEQTIEGEIFHKGTQWLCLVYNNFRTPRDIASESFRIQSERFKPYLPESNFIDPFDPTEEELTMFELLYGTDSKDEYLKWMKAVIKHNEENVDEKQS